MAGEGFYFIFFIFFYFFYFFLKQYFIVFIFDLHMYCDDMQINWDWLFLFLTFFFPICCGDGMFKMYRPMSQLVCGFRFKVSNLWTRP